MISYDPLFQTLKEKGIYISDFRDRLMSPSVIAKINKGEHIRLDILEKICKELDVPVEKVIKID